MAHTDVAVKPIDRAGLQAKIDRGESFVLLETLAPEHFRHAHLPGAKNAPLDRIGELAPVLIPDRHTEVVTYCAGPSCHASVAAAQALMARGYTKVRCYEGGKQDWVAAGLPLEHGA
jgi:rhodanese-related sulfurtransferase